MLTAKEKEEREKLIKDLGIRYTTDDKQEPYIFVSYKSDDWREVMGEIIHPLQKRYGLRVYYDQAFDYESNDEWIKQMEDNMASIYCQGVLCFISEKYISSYATLLEVLFSHTKKVLDYRDNVLPLIQVFLPSCNTGDMKELRKNVLKQPKRSLSLKTNEVKAYKDILNDILRNKTVSDVWSERVRGLLETSDNALTNRDVASAFAELLEGQAIEKYGDNQDQFLEKIKGTIASLVTVKDPSESNVFDEKLKQTIMEEQAHKKAASTQVLQPEEEKKTLEQSGVVEEKPQPVSIPEKQMECVNQEWYPTSEMTLEEVEHALLDVNNCKYLRMVREQKNGYQKYMFDYVMAAVLRGCDHKAEPFSARWNYFRVVVSKDINLDEKAVSASQFTWSSNARKAVNIEKTGKLGANSEYFRNLSGSMTLGELRSKFAEAEDEALRTKDNKSADAVFAALFTKIPV